MLFLAIALMCAPVLQDPAEQKPPSKPYPELVLPHVFGGKPDTYQKQRPVVSILIDGRVTLGDMVFLDASYQGEDAKNGWANLRKELARLSAAMKWMPQVQGAPKVRAGSVLIRADLNSPWRMTRGVMQAMASAEVCIANVDFAVGNARAPKFDPDIGLVPQSSPQQYLRYSIPTEFDLPTTTEGGEGESASSPLGQPEFSIRVRQAGQRLQVLRSAKVPWTGKGRFRFDMSTRHVEYGLGASRVLGYSEFRKILQGMQSSIAGKRATLKLGPKATAAEALSLYDALISLGVGSAVFTAGESQ